MTGGIFSDYFTTNLGFYTDCVIKESWMSVNSWRSSEIMWLAVLNTTLYCAAVITDRNLGMQFSCNIIVLRRIIENMERNTKASWTVIDLWIMTVRKPVRRQKRYLGNCVSFPQCIRLDRPSRLSLASSPWISALWYQHVDLVDFKRRP